MNFIVSYKMTDGGPDLVQANTGLQLVCSKQTAPIIPFGYASAQTRVKFSIPSGVQGRVINSASVNWCLLKEKTLKEGNHASLCADVCNISGASIKLQAGEVFAHVIFEPVGSVRQSCMLDTIQDDVTVGPGAAVTVPVSLFGPGNKQPQMNATHFAIVKASVEEYSVGEPTFVIPETFVGVLPNPLTVRVVNTENAFVTLPKTFAGLWTSPLYENIVVERG
uniref:Uncharacterized protein n=1 Tax=Ditylenchus dipsaci TaxID=166011 RepID=A0A915EE83_9BILA